MSAIKPKCRKPPIFIALSLLFLVVVIAISSSSSFSFFSFGQQTGTGTAKAVADNPAVSSASQQQQQFLAPAAALKDGTENPIMGDPWLNGFGYRKPISLSGSGTTLTDFQVNVTPYIYNETGLVGSWHFSESGGRTTADSSGYGNTGTFVNGANITTDGKFGNAAKFDGVDDYVDLGTPASLQLTTMTIAAWVKKPSGTFKLSEAILASAANGYGFYFTNGNVRFGKVTVSEVSSSITITDTNWHYVVVTYNGTTAVFYNDAILNSSQAYANPSFASTQKTIGNRPDDAANTFNGTIDEVRIYNRTLSASEVQQQYQASKARLDYADIRFTDATGTTLLPFWMESDGKFWVKVPSIPTTGTTIYAYYGNPQANDAQNGTGTFEFFDDFSGDLGKWDSTQSTAGNVQIVSGEARIGGSGTWNANGMTSRDNIFRPKVIEWTSRPSTTAMSTMEGYSVQPIAYSSGLLWNKDNPDVLYRRLDNVVQNYGTFSAAQVKAKMSLKPSQGYTIFWDGVQKEDNSVWATDGNKISYQAMTASTYLYVDDVRVRKYASPEPSATQGTEESLTTMSGGAQNWTWKVPTVGEKVRTGGAQDWNWKPFQQYLGRYRKPISISGSGTTLTDYQVNVTPYIYNETGLVGSWHFSESSGRTTADSSGYGNTGLITGGSNQTTDGKFGNAMKFDGTDDYITLGSDSSLSVQTGTFMAWAKVNAFQSNKFILADFDATGMKTNGALRIETAPNKHFAFSQALTNNSYLSYSSQTARTENTWYHVAAVRNSTHVSIYVNGELDGSETYSGTIVSLQRTKYIGVSALEWGDYFNGTIDEVRIYNRTLSVSEIQSLYNATRARLDYADIRFTSSDGATLLPFWMEQDGKFWVKVPSIPTTGTTIYAYYGNPLATDAQNATGTFEFFDDFSGTAINSIKWTEVDPNNYITQNDKLIFSAGGAWGTTGISSVNNFARPFVYETKMKLNTLLNGPAIGIKDSGAGVSYSDYVYSTYHYATKIAAYEDSSLYDDIGTAPSTGVDYWFKTEVLSTGAKYYRSLDNKNTWTLLRTSEYSSEAPLKIGASPNTGAMEMDNTFVRKYASSPEPSAVNGTEEDSPIPQNITVPVGGATNWTWYPS